MGCQPCADGTTNNALGSTSCEWCDAGYGWDGAQCEICVVGTFAGEASFDTACNACEPGLTTNSTGALTCAVLATPDPSLLSVIVAVVFFVLGIVALVVSCIRKRDARHGAIATVLLSVWAFLCVILMMMMIVITLMLKRMMI